MHPQLTSSLETTPYAFLVTSGLAATVVTIITVGGLSKVNKLRRIGLGQGVFGEYSPSQARGRSKGGADVYGRKATYYDSAAKRRAQSRWTGMRG